MIKNIELNGNNATISYDNGKSIVVNKDYLSKTAKDFLKEKEEKEQKAMESLFGDESVSDAEYYAVLNNKLSIGRLNKIRSYIKFYSKKIGLELQGDELATSDNAETLYNDFMSYYSNNSGKLANICAKTANLIADYQEAVFC